MIDKAGHERRGTGRGAGRERRGLDAGPDASAAELDAGLDASAAELDAGLDGAQAGGRQADRVPAGLAGRISRPGGSAGRRPPGPVERRPYPRDQPPRLSQVQRREDDHAPPQVAEQLVPGHVLTAPFEAAEVAPSYWIATFAVT